MKRQVVLITAFLLGTLLFSCRKKIFHRVELHGRVVNYVTGQPESARIVFWGNDYPGDHYSVMLSSGNTNSDGSFHFKSQAARHPYYTLIITPSSVNHMIEKGVELKEGSNVNVGDILTGNHTFFCKVTAVSTSGASIDFGQGNAFGPGGTHQFLSSGPIEADLFYNIFGQSYPLSFKLSTAVSDSMVFIPIHLPNDTVSTTINY